MTITPLYQLAFDQGAQSKYLNPANEGQSRASVYFGKPLRIVARLVYGVGCIVLAPGVGILYHTLKAIDARIMASAADQARSTVLKDRAIQHLSAALKDLSLLVGTCVALTFTYSTFTLGLRNIKNNVADEKLTFGLSCLGAAAALSLPMAFALAPNNGWYRQI